MVRGTEIIFDYALPLSLLDDEARQAISAIMADAPSRGEPLISVFEPQNLAARVRELGFAEVWDSTSGPKKRPRILPAAAMNSGFQHQVRSI